MLTRALGRSVILDDTCMDDAVSSGNIKLIKLVAATVGTGRICELAALHGHMDILVWARRNKYAWSTYVCSNAALCGRLDIIMWSRKRGCRWSQHTVYAASKAGHIHILEYMLTTVYHWYCSDVTMPTKHGQTAVLDWIHTRVNIDGQAQLISLMAAGHNRSNILEWLEKRDLQYNIRDVLCVAAETGSVDVFKWCIAKGCLPDDDVLLSAARGGSLEMCKMLNTGLKWSVEATAHAVFNQCLQVIKWVVENDYPVDSRIFSYSRGECKEYIDSVYEMIGTVVRKKTLA
jgi:hypothetical protein